MDYYRIHETVIRDIADVITDVNSAIENNGGIAGVINRKNSFKSIAQASSNLTLVFPVLASTNLNIETASMVAKAIERKAVTMLQMLFSAISITTLDNGIDFIKKFHTNLKIDDKMSVDSFMDAMDKFIVNQESAGNIILDKDVYNVVKEDMKNLDFTLPDNISESSINNYKVLPSYRFGYRSVVKEAKGDIYDPLNKVKQINKNEVETFTKQVMPSDIRKANELVPTMMVINYISVETGEAIPVNMVIGVKAKLYSIDSEDIINRISVKNKDTNGFNSFIRASTREISFFRDFLFAIDKAKVDALSQSRKGSSSKIWKILERRSLKSKIRRTLGQTNDASAITTLLISQEEVEYLKKSESINIEDPKVIRPIMESYNFMGVCIADESMEISKFIFDTGEDIYEKIAFTSLEREAADNSYKKVINLMSKMH